MYRTGKSGKGRTATERERFPGQIKRKRKKEAPPEGERKSAKVLLSQEKKAQLLARKKDDASRDKGAPSRREGPTLSTGRKWEENPRHLYLHLGKKEGALPKGRKKASFRYRYHTEKWGADGSLEKERVKGAPPCCKDKGKKKEKKKPSFNSNGEKKEGGKARRTEKVKPSNVHNSCGGESEEG